MTEWKNESPKSFVKLFLLCDVLGEANNIKQEEKEMLLLEEKVDVSHAKHLGDLHEGRECSQEKELLASSHEQSQAQEEALSMLDPLNNSLQAEKMARLEIITAPEEAKQREEKDLNALGKERKENQELRSALEVQREEVSRLVQEGGQRQQESNKLREQVRELTARLEASQLQVGPKLEKSPLLKIEWFKLKLKQKMVF